MTRYNVTFSISTQLHPSKASHRRAAEEIWRDLVDRDYRGVWIVTDDHGVVETVDLDAEEEDMDEEIETDNED